MLLLTLTVVAVEPVTALVTFAFRLIVLALSVVVPVDVVVPLTWMTSPASVPALTVRLVLRCALSALVMVMVSVPATAVVLITMALPRTLACSKSTPAESPLMMRASVRPSMRSPFVTVTLSAAPGSDNVNVPTLTKSTGSRPVKWSVPAPEVIIPLPVVVASGV